MEGAPKPIRREAPGEMLVHTPQETVPTPEYWKEHRDAPPSRDYVDLEIQAARILADKMGKPLVETAKEYTTLLHSHLWPDTDGYIETEGLSDEELVTALYESEKNYYESKPPLEYHEGIRYGCFKYHHQIDVPVVDIHFENAELADAGPLADENIDHRLQELHDMFSEIKREYPDTKEVEGNSWLYNIEKYKRLFPESYTSNPTEDPDAGFANRGRQWGQFMDNKRNIKKELAETFLANLAALEEVTPEKVREAFPLKALMVRGPIEDFYTKYGV